MLSKNHYNTTYKTPVEKSTATKVLNIFIFIRYVTIN